MHDAVIKPQVQRPHLVHETVIKPHTQSWHLECAAVGTLSLHGQLCALINFKRQQQLA